jgi:hypothetical protein
MKKKIMDMSLFACSTFTEVHRGFFQSLENTKASNYDQIMDRIYNDNHIGGGFHRHFDGSHTLVGSYQKIHAAEGQVDAVDYAKSHWDELVTPNGIPFRNLDHKDFNQFTNELSDATGGLISGGQIRGYLYDMNSLTAGEALSAGLGALFMYKALHSGDPKAISRTSALNLSLGFLTGNPVQVIVGLGGVGIGLYQGKIQAWDMLMGAAPTVAGFSAAKVAIALGAPGWAGVGAGIVGGFGTMTLLAHLEAKKQETVKEELGNYERYVPVMTPALVQRQIEIEMRKLPSLGVTI